MITLAIDTASQICAVAIVENGTPLACVSENIGKGHAEKLIDQIVAATKESNISLARIDRLAVDIGPGSFTGVRIGVATSRALSLALSKVAIGVSSLEAIAFDAHKVFPENTVVSVIDAGRDMVYRQDFDQNLFPLAAAQLQSNKDIIDTIGKNAVVAGPYAATIGEMLASHGHEIYAVAAPDIVSFALLAEQKTPDCLPKPLYLRAADAKQQRSFALPRKKQ